jgi:heat shock protein HslJ
MRRGHAFYSMLSMLILLLAACAPQASRTQGSPTPPNSTGSPARGGFENIHWSLVTFGPAEAKKPIVEGSNITLMAADGQFGGFGGCNSYGGAYEITGNQLSFHDINSTLKACVDEQVMQQEQGYFEALKSAGTFEVEGNYLTIAFNNGQGVLEFEKAVAISG